MTNEQIINHFTSAFTRDDNTTSRKALKVRDGKLYSYNLVIAEYVVEEGFQGILIHDHWAKGLGMVSSTTSQHVGMILRATKLFPRKVKSEEGVMF
jgi:hypothetical protein